MSSKNPQKSVVIFGATSAVAQQLGRQLAADTEQFVLCARDSDKLDTVAQDIRSRGAAQVNSIIVDFSEPSNYADLFSRIQDQTDTVDVWYFFHGNLPDQVDCEASLDVAQSALQTNFLSVVDMLHPIANLVQEQGSGTIVVVSSVAGDRGRGSNYFYGTAKGGLSLYLQGLRNRLTKHGGSVIDVKPGFIRSPMTAHLDTTGFLWATPEKIALDIISAVEKKRDTIYTPGYWRLIMFVICSIPERIFKRLSL